MSNTYTFVTNCNRFQIVIKDEFLSIVNKPEEVSIYELVAKHNLAKYLHNTQGPAISRLNTDRVEYWMDGERVPDEEAKKIVHNNKFNKKVQDLFVKE